MSEKDSSEENIWAFEETVVWFDSVGNSTVEKIGTKIFEMFTAGHDKQNITVGLCASSAGKKKVSYIIFRGNDNTAEDKQLKSGRDVEINFSNNGWFNTDLTLQCLHKIFQTFLKAHDQNTIRVWVPHNCGSETRCKEAVS